MFQTVIVCGVMDAFPFLLVTSVWKLLLWCFSFFIYCRPHYNLILESISVNGQILPIDPSIFATSSTRGTIVDTGTTLTYLTEEAYDPFVSAVSCFDY